MTEANRMAQIVKLSLTQNQMSGRRIITINTDCHYEQDDEPTFWVNELRRYVTFEEMSYNPSIGWFIER